MNREQMITHLTLLGYYPVYAYENRNCPALARNERAGSNYGTHGASPSGGHYCDFWVAGNETRQEWGIFTTGNLRTMMEKINADPSLEP